MARAADPVRFVGNAHLDPAWMWRMPEGLEAFAATCRSALERIEEFPGFIFTASSAAHYAVVEATDAPLFERIRRAVTDGRWCFVGGWWVEPDCNLPSGESFVRQALLGQRYFASRFGRIATTGYNIDSFGHQANLPQLLRKAGLTSYVFMRPQQEEKKLPASLFSWEAPSGDRVTAYRLPLHYSNAHYGVREKFELLPSFELFDPKQPWMLFFGVGNHGGGPTIEQIREVLRLESDGNRAAFSDPDRFFAAVDRKTIPTVRDEMQPHAIGCYSAHSEIKRLNRFAERALQQAEAALVLERMMGTVEHGSKPERESLTKAWQHVCFNQFHDLLGGVAIREACDDAISMFREAISIADRIKSISLARIASKVGTGGSIENLIVFNLAAHTRREWIEFELWHPDASERGEELGSVTLMGPDGTEISTQQIEPSGKIGKDRIRCVAKVPVPALGWNTFEIRRSHEAGEKRDAEITLPFLHTPAMIVRDDSDTWAHGKHSFADFDVPFTVESREVIERGPVRNGIRIASGARASRMEEEIFWEPESPVVEIRYFLDWREQHHLLKLRFPHGCSDPVATYEIPYAWLRRPIGEPEWPGQSWVNVSERDGSHGLAIVTDCKYSYSVDREYIYVIAARSPLYAWHVPPHERHSGERERYLDQGEQEFRVLSIRHEGSWSGSVLGRFKNPLIVRTESRHAGLLPKYCEGMDRRSRAVHVGAIKLAEEGTAVIVRAVEQAGETSDAEFSIPNLKAHWNTKFSPFEIKTFSIEDGNVTEVDLLERPL